MLRTIKAEAKSNQVVLNDSFLKYYDSGIVLREFGVETACQYLADPVFIKHAGPKELETLNAYLRNINLANAYREKAERFQLDERRQKSKDWLNSTIAVWGENLELCQVSIHEVLRLE